MYGELHGDAVTNYLRRRLAARYHQAGVVLTESDDFTLPRGPSSGERRGRSS
ncbi:MAG: hypothetical protein IT373_32545 [Polyangiaceae bacterium]|nr:hypothetical protein [Polyangiaceae bacterium]